MAISDYRVITREQFGMALYECIQKFSERAWIRASLNRMILLNLQTVTTLELGRCNKARLKQREAQLTQEITGLMSQLEPADVKRLLDHYETKGAA